MKIQYEVGDTVKVKTFPYYAGTTTVQKVKHKIFVGQTEPFYWIGQDPNNLFGMFSGESLEPVLAAIRG